MPPRILTSLQPLRAGVTHPASLYSRVAAALAVVKAPAVNAFGYTAALGNKLWLKKVQVWFMPVWKGGGDWVDFWVRNGTGTPATYAAMTNWEDVLPVNWLGAGPVGYRELATGKVFEWEMNRLFEGEGIRFGVQLSVAPLVTYEEMYATFQIAEG